MNETKLLSDIKHLLLEYVNQSSENAFTVRRDMEEIIDDVMTQRFIAKRQISESHSTH